MPMDKKHVRNKIYKDNLKNNKICQIRTIFHINIVIKNTKTERGTWYTLIRIFRVNKLRKDETLKKRAN